MEKNEEIERMVEDYRRQLLAEREAWGRVLSFTKRWLEKRGVRE